MIERCLGCWEASKASLGQIWGSEEKAKMNEKLIHNEKNEKNEIIKHYEISHQSSERSILSGLELWDS